MSMCLFIFKQKTAYEMRIRDGSSDVCSSDLDTVRMPKPSAPERAQPEQRSAQVPETAAGRRFDAVLAELFPEFSRSRLAEWIKSGDALLDGNAVRPREPVRGGEAVTLSVLLDTRTEARKGVVKGKGVS